ncbi:MAG: GGDEF domain-containing protein [Acidimicrobiia bacterium]
MQSIRAVLGDPDIIVEVWRTAYSLVAPEGGPDPLFEVEVVDLAVSAFSRERAFEDRLDADVERLADVVSAAAPSISVVCALLSALGEAVVGVSPTLTPVETVNELRQRVYVVITGAMSIAASRVATRLATEAYRDRLTALLNRRAFERDLYGLFEEAEGNRSFSLAMMDIDGLKTVNDTQGHDAGDSLIQTVARSLSEGLPQSATPYRWGGDEFAVLAVETRAMETMELLDAVRQEHGLPISCGVAEFPGDARTPDELSRIADERSYQDKRRRRRRSAVGRLFAGTHRLFERT